MFQHGRLLIAGRPSTGAIVNQLTQRQNNTNSQAMNRRVFYKTHKCELYVDGEWGLRSPTPVSLHSLRFGQVVLMFQHVKLLISGRPSTGRL